MGKKINLQYISQTHDARLSKVIFYSSDFMIKRIKIPSGKNPS